MRIIPARFFAIVVFVLLAQPAYAACTEAPAHTWTAETASRSDFVECIRKASNGDTIILPSGTATYTSTVTIGKYLTIRGSGIGQTIIRDGVNDGDLIEWTCVSGHAHRLTGIEFQDGGRRSTNNTGIIKIQCTNAASTTFRFDHSKFGYMNGTKVRFHTTVGVFDHNTVHLGSFPAIRIHDDAWDGRTEGDGSWFAATNWGSGNQIYLEDNTFTGDVGTMQAIGDAWGGARFTARFNTLIRAQFSVHGTESPGRSRGAKQLEIYANSMTGKDDTCFSAAVDIRSGSGLIFENDMPNWWQCQPGFQLTANRMFFSFLPWGTADGTNQWDVNDAGGPFNPGSSCPGASNLCTATSGGSYTVTVAGANFPNLTGYSIKKISPCMTSQCASVITSNTSTTLTFHGEFTGTPMAFKNGETFRIYKVTQALDQGCVTGGSLVTGAPFTPPMKWNTQTVEKCYEWNNHYSDHGTGYIHFVPQLPGIYTENQHYYNYTTSFNGTAGVGRGVRASRPATCTTGVAYWSTDQGSWNDGSNPIYTADGVLDKCTSTNTWTNAWYTPYPYPHPLVSAGGR